MKLNSAREAAHKSCSCERRLLNDDPRLESAVTTVYRSQRLLRRSLERLQKGLQWLLRSIDQLA